MFRAHGYEGATLALIGEATGLGKGSLYHFFPGGKAQMAAEVLAEIDNWFETNIFAPLRKADDPARAIAAMVGAVDNYFRSGHRVCLVGVIALGASRDMFAVEVRDYFSRWNDALARVLARSGLSARVGAAAIDRCAAQHSGRAGVGAGAGRSQGVWTGDGRRDGAAAGKAGLTPAFIADVSPDAAQRPTGRADQLLQMRSALQRFDL